MQYYNPSVASLNCLTRYHTQPIPKACPQFTNEEKVTRTRNDGMRGHRKL